MSIHYGFNATITAHPGKGDALLALLLAAPSLADEACLVFLVSRSASNPDLVSVTEGWSNKDAHSQFFGSAAAQAFIAALVPLVAGESVYADMVPAGGKAVLR